MGYRKLMRLVWGMYRLVAATVQQELGGRDE
jgi:hypothetical protein